ncbi:Short-chain dehydrogenase TIC 32, chloroplastic [Cocos nucifera]|uniref:Short-chain dehydrogenase TIC 32, chloroplastic n=1 Tax=Cocos nucifera TaxID=13894 RepID=A0A8K0IM03_COCNU|nr:Short-chain dehydrogenase TIC 32, chloroplastic [Cocos nucifera]
MWPFNRKGPSGFSWYSTAEEVTQGLDGSGLTAIVTGASSGIGSETARVLALRGVHVVMAVRNLSTGASVKEAIVKEIPTAKVDVMELDLTSMASDGIELQFATNHVGHFLLTHLLLENMKNTSRESKIEGRIVNVSSEGHRFAFREGICFDKINDQSGYSSWTAYGQSKLANILHANELSRRFEEEGVEITANSLHPGSIITNLLRYHSFIDVLSRTVGKLVLKNVQQDKLRPVKDHTGKLSDASLYHPVGRMV